MSYIGDMLHGRKDDFGEGDHQEYVESGTRDVVLIAGAALVMIGGFIWSLAG
jgi:hypothetical protein